MILLLYCYDFTLPLLLWFFKFPLFFSNFTKFLEISKFVFLVKNGKKDYFFIFCLKWQNEDFLTKSIQILNTFVSDLSDIDIFPFIPFFWHFSNYAQQDSRTYWWTTFCFGLGRVSDTRKDGPSKDNEWPYCALGRELYLTSCYRCFNDPRYPRGWLQVYLKSILYHRRRGLEVQYWGQLQNSTQVKARKDHQTWVVNNYFSTFAFFYYIYFFLWTFYSRSSNSSSYPLALLDAVDFLL